MSRPRTPSPRPTSLLALVLVAASLLSACRFMPSRPYWIEAHGEAPILRVGAWPGGALAIGTDRRLYGYPGAWSRPWLPQGTPQELRAIAASQAAVYGILADGQVARFAGGTWTPYAGSTSWGASEIGATEDDRLLVVVGGHVRAVEGVDLKEGACSSVASVVVAGARGDEIFVLDGEGGLHHGEAGRCEPVQTPVRLQRIAATPERLLGVGADGAVWRLRDGAWTALPPVRKFRAGRAAFQTRAREVAVSAYSTWIMDDEGAVFLLSDET